MCGFAGSLEYHFGVLFLSTMAFRFQGLKCHLTYKTHLDLEELKGKILMKLPETKLWSFVHENGDTEEENPTPYEHTHVLYGPQTKMQVKSAGLLN